MNIKKIKNDRYYFWTNHVKYKILQYGLSPSLIKKVISRPQRTEYGIAPDTVAQMIRKDGKKTKKEVWVMYQKKNKNSKIKIKNEGKIKIISAWIYPGVSPKGKEIFVPIEALEEIEKESLSD